MWCFPNPNKIPPPLWSFYTYSFAISQKYLAVSHVNDGTSHSHAN